MADPAPKKILIPVPDELLEFVPRVLVRLRYLYEDLVVSYGSQGLEVVANDEKELPKMRKEILYQLYREKIFHDTLPLRRELYKMLAN